MGQGGGVRRRGLWRSAWAVALLAAGPCRGALLDLGPIDVPLEMLKLTYKDLRVKPGYTDDQVGGGALRLSAVSEGLRSAVGAGALARDLGYTLTGGSDLAGAFEALAPLLDGGPARVAPPPGPLHATAPLMAALAAPDRREELDSQGPAPEGEPRLPPEIRQAGAALVYGLARANALLTRGKRDLTPDDEALIRKGLPAVLSVLLSQQSVDTATLTRSLRAAAKLNTRDLTAAAATLIGSVEEARARLRPLAPDNPLFASGAAAQPVLFSQQTPFGDVVISGTGNDVHRTPAALLLDLGGDDRYELTAPTDRPAPPIQVMLDLRGNDTYESGEPFGPGAAMLGISVVVDEAGDDTYISRQTFSFGAAACGVGVLVDAAGKDRYLGSAFSQGAALFGLGLLLDGGGDDIQDATLCSQGFGGVKGVGALVNLGGNDRYHAGGVYEDPVRGKGRMLALSQGFGWGLRPFVSGGVGILADAEGNDVYTADNYSQGAGYWYGEGVLFDRQGNDTCIGGECSQGVGAFLSLGLLLDERGNDRYVATDTAQGVGRDLGIGLLRDAMGDDTYAADRMAQGAASRGGVGLLADLGGVDSYEARDEARGHTPAERASAGIGLFVDGDGGDSFGGPGGSDLLWVDGELGAGIDAAAGGLEALKAVLPLSSGRLTLPIRLPSAGTPPAPAEAAGGSETELEALFRQATSGDDPAERRRASQTLARLGEKAAPYVAARLSSPDSDIVREARNILLQIGSAAVPELLKIMGEENARQAQAAMTLLGQIGDPRAATPLVEQAKSPQWRTRAAAAAGMGALRGDDTALALQQLLRDEDEDVRRSAAMALGYRGAAESAEAISEVLGDPVASVRFAAADALVRLGVPCPPHVFSLVGCEQPEVRHLSIETFGRLGSRNSLDILLGLMGSPEWGDRAFAAEAIYRIGDAEACRKLEALLLNERNGLVLAKARAAMNATKLRSPFGEE